MTYKGQRFIYPFIRAQHMFFVLIFLILAATTSYLFPEWSWVTVLLVSFGCVAALRILLAVTSRTGSTPRNTE
jgi:hypothetical protein